MLPWKKKKKDDLDEENYVMKEKFEANKLCIANLEYVSSSITEAHTPMCHRTELKYIFEIIKEKDTIKYREIFTGFITEHFNDCSLFDKPYVQNIEPFIDYFPLEKDKQVHKYSMILRLDYINKHNKKNNKIKKKSL